jgi:hypothetical protein
MIAEQGITTVLNTLLTLIKEYKIWYSMEDVDFKNYCYDKISKSIKEQDNFIGAKLREKYSNLEIQDIHNQLNKNGYYPSREVLYTMFYTNEIERIIDKDFSNTEKMVRIFDEIEKLILKSMLQQVTILLSDKELINKLR